MLAQAKNVEGVAGEENRGTEVTFHRRRRNHLMDRAGACLACSPF